MKRILAVSDIHGHKTVLKNLLKQVKYNPESDQLILLGDYINKGPESKATLEYVIELVDNGAVALIGNNEARVIQENDSDYVKYVPFIKKLKLYYAFGGYIFSHAGFRASLDFESQIYEDVCGLNKLIFEQKVFSDKISVFGHTPTFRLGAKIGDIWASEGLMCIDTGAGHGQYLSLVDLSGGKVYRQKVNGDQRVECGVGIDI